MTYKPCNNDPKHTSTRMAEKEKKQGVAMAQSKIERLKGCSGTLRELSLNKSLQTLKSGSSINISDPNNEVRDW